jgi:hypothetical protein
MLTSLGVLVILGLLGGVFLAHMRLESAYAGRDAHQLKAHYLAVAGVEDAIARLAADSPLVDSYADIWWMGSSPGMTPLGQGGYTLTVWDEAARIDVMNASPQMLGTLIGGDAEALALILNFRSSRKLFTIADFAAADLKAGALDKLTALGTALDIRKVNINTAGADVIAALPGMDAEAAQIIVEFRKGPDGEEGTADDFVFADPADLVKAPGLGTVRTAPAIPFLKSNSNIFRIESVGAVVEGPRTVSARKIISVVKRDQNGRIHIESWENS